LGARSLPLGYNAVAESFFGTLKLELVFWEKYITHGQAKRSIVDYIEMFYNSNRRHSYLDYMTPMEYEKLWPLKKAA
jgi:putative transposase